MRPIQLPAGVVSTPTPSVNTAFWQEAHLMRWEAGRLCPVGGWEKMAYPPTASRIRAVHSWVAMDNTTYTAYLCEGHVYVEVGGQLIDISPETPLVQPYADLTAGGFGDNIYSLDEYGTPRPQRPLSKSVAPAYTMDNWGEELLIMTSPDGRLLRWSPSSFGDVANPVPDAPIGRSFVVTSERHVMMIGLNGDPLTFGWSDQENYSNWDFANVASKAGKYTLEDTIVSIRLSERGGAIIHTTKGAVVSRHIGMPYIYDYDVVAKGTTPISAASIVAAGNRTVWYSENGFWEFDGSSVVPLACAIQDWINDKIDLTKSRFEASMVDMVSIPEIWFMFTGKGSDCNNYVVIWNYVENWWSMARLSRSCGFGSTYTTYPVLCDGYNVYRHESGEMYPGITEAPWAETYTMNIGSGAAMMTINDMMPDVEGDIEALLFSFKVKNDRSRAPERQSRKLPILPDGRVGVRETGRDFRMRIEARTPSAKDWTMGQTLINYVQRGGR